jgi:NifU-like protein involved in Fe-S cluster formation
MCTKKVMDHFINPLNMREIDIAVSHQEKEVGKDFERWM